MGLIGQHLVEKRATYTAALSSLKDPGTFLLDWFRGGRKSASGVDVTEESALASTAVFACVRILSETLATIPVKVFQRQEDGGRREAREHHLWPLIHEAPNPEMTSFAWRETQMGHVVSWGNGYAAISFNGRGQPSALWPLRPDRTFPKRENKVLRYIHRDASGAEDTPLRPDQVLHVAGLGFDGLVGYSPIGLHRDAIGLGLAAAEHGARLFANQARPAGILKVDKRLGAKARKNLKASWEAYHRGLGDQAHRIAVLEEGISWQQVGFPPEDLQYLGLRKFEVAEIARIFRMQLHKIAEMDRATFSNIEQQAIEHVVDTILPWVVRWEQELNRKLLTPVERAAGFFIAFVVDGLLRGDFETRMKGYAIAVSNGLFSRNEVRAMENKPFREGGDELTIQINMGSLATIVGGNAGDDGGGGNDDGDDDERTDNAETRAVDHRVRIQNAHLPLLRREASRVVQTEVRAVRRALSRTLGKRDRADLVEWLTRFYGDELTAEIAESFRPIFETLGDELGIPSAEEAGFAGDDLRLEELQVFIAEYSEALGRRHVESSKGQLLDIIARAEAFDEEELLDRMEQRLGEWEEKRPEKIADRERTQFGSAFTKAAWIGLGVLGVIWVARGKNCPFCDQLNGQRRSMRQPFKAKGDTTQAPGRTPLKSFGSIGHPPLHKGCDCSIRPG